MGVNNQPLDPCPTSWHGINANHGGPSQDFTVSRWWQDTSIFQGVWCQPSTVGYAHQMLETLVKSSSKEWSGTKIFLKLKKVTEVRLTRQTLLQGEGGMHTD